MTRTVVHQYEGAHATMVHGDPGAGYGRPDDSQERVIGRKASILPRGDRLGGNVVKDPVVNVVSPDADGNLTVQRSSSQAMYSSPPKPPTEEPAVIPPPPQPKPQPVTQETTYPPTPTKQAELSAVDLLNALRALVPLPQPVAVPAAVPTKEPEVPAVPVAETKVVVPDDRFDSLKVADLSMEATEPKFRVEFYLGGAGRQQAWYHWVDEGSNSIALIFDTRFKYGTKYTPPGSKQPIKIKVWLKDSSRVYNVYSCDLMISFGVFEILVLPVAAEPAAKPAPPPPVHPDTRLHSTPGRHGWPDEPGPEEYGEIEDIDPSILDSETVAMFRTSVLE